MSLICPTMSPICPNMSIIFPLVSETCERVAFLNEANGDAGPVVLHAQDRHFEVLDLVLPSATKRRI